MFSGISKHLGNGWRVGIGTRLKGSKKPSSKEIREAEFIKFIQKAKVDLEALIIGFAVANSGDYEQIKKEHDNVFGDSADILRKYPNDLKF